jgi:uncharacterized tellurite resistance protein B-like protein
MNGKSWNEVLRLLSMMILIDGKVFEEEIEAFKDAAIALRDMVDPSLVLTRHMAGDWFTQHRDEIAIGVSHVFYESTVSKTLERLNDIEDKKGLLVALLKVAMSDGVKHPAEEKLFNSACETWGLEVQLAS